MWCSLLQQVNDHETWIYNLTQANERPAANPEWFREYAFREAFDVADLAPATLDALLTRLSGDAALLQRYWQYKVKLGDPSLARGCDNECLADELCALASTQATPDARNARCQQLMSAFWQTVGGRRRFGV